MGILAWAALIVVLAAAAICGYFLLKRRRSLAPTAAERTEPGGRLEILETTPVDETRKLVLIRCDHVEHLMMIGGPADVVVENDVRRGRLAGSAASAIAPVPSLTPAPSLASSAAFSASKQSPRPALEARGNGAARKFGDAPRAEPTAKPPGGNDLQAPIVPPVEPPVRAPAQPRPSLAAVPAAAGTASVQNGTSTTTPAPQPPARNSQAAAPAQPQRRTDEKAARQEAKAKAKAQDDPPHVDAPAGSVSAEIQGPPAEQRNPASETVGGGEPARSPALPVAQTPWPESDSIENEIVRALRSDAKPPAPVAAPSRAAAAQPSAPASRTPSNASTTLGDLAERLEEALAREVQHANQGRAKLDLGLDAFVSDTKPAATAPAPERATPAGRERGRGILAAPEPEARAQGRESAPVERKEEAPVINLNARRREAADPLEDEMARLLGELTSDTNRR